MKATKHLGLYKETDYLGCPVGLGKLKKPKVVIPKKGKPKKEDNV